MPEVIVHMAAGRTTEQKKALMMDISQAVMKKRGRSVMLVAADLQRPAAVEQLHTVAEQVKAEMAGGATVSFYSEPDKTAAYGKAA